MREKAQVFDEFVLKIVAILTMTLDHIGLFMLKGGYFADGSVGYITGFVFQAVGRLAFPLFALMLAEGMRKTHDRENYLLRLALIWGLVFLAEFILSYTSYSSWMMEQAFTDLLMYGLFIFFIEKKGYWKLLAILPLVWIVLSYAMDFSEVYAADNGLISSWSIGVPLYLRCGYSLYGFLLFLGFYYAYPIADSFLKKASAGGTDLSEFSAQKPYRSLINSIDITVLVFVTVIFWAIHYFAGSSYDPYDMGIQSYCLLDIFLFLAYNGHRGYDKHWFRYAEYFYYPVHIALIAAIFALIFR